MAEKHANSSGVFVRLTNDGDSIIGAFCGEPFAREVIWNGERYETFDPDEHRDCKPSLRVMLNFYVPSEHDMKVIEGGTVWFKDILKLRDKYGLENWLFEIQRHGEAGNPKTKYTILPEEKLDDERRGQIAGAELHDLAALSSGDADKGGDKPASKLQGKDVSNVSTNPKARTQADHAQDAYRWFMSDDSSSSGGPIDLRDVSQLVGRLKQLPRSDVDAFLEQFKVKRVRDLKASDVPKAKQALDRLEAAMRATDDEDEDIDPFA